jgi:hypothetical protein
MYDRDIPLKAKDVPSVLFQSPSRVAPDAQDAAFESVAPATTGVPLGIPVPSDASAETVPMTSPGSTTLGNIFSGIPSFVSMNSGHLSR